MTRWIVAIGVVTLGACGDPEWKCTCSTSCDGRSGAAYESNQCGGSNDRLGVTTKATSACETSLATSCSSGYSYCVCTCAESSSFCG